jgi:hypothetical protein
LCTIRFLTVGNKMPRQKKKNLRKKLIGFRINLVPTKKRKASIHETCTIEPTSESSYNKYGSYKQGGKKETKLQSAVSSSTRAVVCVITRERNKTARRPAHVRVFPRHKVKLRRYSPASPISFSIFLPPQHGNEVLYI